MTVATKLKRSGDSLDLSLPSSILEALNATAGDDLTLEMDGERVILTKTRRAPTLDDLLALCDPFAPEDPEILEWRNMEPVGREFR